MGRASFDFHSNRSDEISFSVGDTMVSHCIFVQHFKLLTEIGVKLFVSLMCTVSPQSYICKI